MQSCRSTGLPRKWTVTISGTSVHKPSSSSTETTRWNATTTLHISNIFESTVDYVDDNVTTGSYSVEGNNGSCTLSGSGDLESDDGYVEPSIDASAGTIRIQWGILESAASTRSCPDGQSYSYSARVDGKEQFTVPFQPDSGGVVTLHRTFVSDSGTSVDYTLTMTPLG
jgi:hypothetical protein